MSFFVNYGFITEELFVSYAPGPGVINYFFYITPLLATVDPIIPVYGPDAAPIRLFLSVNFAYIYFF